MAGIDVRHLGEFIREQRDLNNISLRQLAKLAGVSNPYLSQIERGLRKPSAEILQQIAKGLRISAEALYVQAGILDQRHDAGLVADAVLADEGLTERQKQVLLEIYDSFRKENAASSGGDATVSLVTATSELPTDLSTDEVEPPARPRRPRATPADGAAPRSTTPRSPSPRKRAGGPAASA
jgi:transcriptional regulator with XRE-family HTH domain